MKCYVPDCKNQIPKWREKAKRITCSKKCTNAWNWTSTKTREEIRGKKIWKKKNLKNYWKIQRGKVD